MEGLLCLMKYYRLYGDALKAVDSTEKQPHGCHKVADDLQILIPAAKTDSWRCLTEELRDYGCLWYRTCGRFNEPDRFCQDITQI